MARSGFIDLMVNGTCLVGMESNERHLRAANRRWTVVHSDSRRHREAESSRSHPGGQRASYCFAADTAEQDVIACLLLHGTAPAVAASITKKLRALTASDGQLARFDAQTGERVSAKLKDATVGYNPEVLPRWEHTHRLWFSRADIASGRAVVQSVLLNKSPDLLLSFPAQHVFYVLQPAYPLTVAADTAVQFYLESVGTEQAIDVTSAVRSVVDRRTLLSPGLLNCVTHNAVHAIICVSMLCGQGRASPGNRPHTHREATLILKAAALPRGVLEHLMHFVVLHEPYHLAHWGKGHREMNIAPELWISELILNPANCIDDPSFNGRTWEQRRVDVSDWVDGLAVEDVEVNTLDANDIREEASRLKAARLQDTQQRIETARQLQRELQDASRSCNKQCNVQ